MGDKLQQKIKKSKKLSYLLRHYDAPPIICLDGGWASVSDVLQRLKIGRDELDEIVASDDKRRFAYDATGEWIRANQGHSIPGVKLELESFAPPKYLYHSTSVKTVDAILREGLKPMRRQWVHISPDAKTAEKVGKRHGKPAVLEIRALDFKRDGHELYRSANGVWLAKYVPPEYIDAYFPEEESLLTGLITDPEMYAAVKSLGEFVNVHAIYKPDGSVGILGECYCAAVDLLAPGMTFRVYFKMADGKIEIVEIERWRFG